jgi:RimJ/RimL family protein N-acetyltransferase
MKKLCFIKVSSEPLIKIVESLAKTIWSEYYTPIIGKPQVEYMLENFQSKKAIRRQLRKEHFLYYLLRKEREYIGYIGIVPDRRRGELFLSKIYVVAGERKKGYGTESLAFIERVAQEMELRKISLTVNKNNIGSIRAYQDLGFKKVAACKTDIGSGFVMDDYVMEKRLA